MTNEELYKQYNEYVRLAIEYSKKDANKIKELINVMDDVPKEIFEAIYNKVISKDVISLKDEEKYIIWDEIGRASCRERV